MRIKLLNQGLSGYRMIPFIKSIIKYGHFVFGSPDYKADTETQMWLVEYVGDIFTGQKRSVQDFFNSIKNEFLSYEGKIIFFSLDDHSYSVYEGLDPEILNRVDAWFVHAFREKHICESIRHKYIQIPMFNSQYVNDCSSLEKQNKIYFRGFYHHDRVETIKRIKKDPYLRKNFVGGLYVPADFKDNEISEYLFYEQISLNDFHREMGSHLISLCPKGNTRWGHRQIDAMGNKTSIISNSLMPDVNFLHKDLIEKYMYIYAGDMSNFEDVCKYALNNLDETKYRAEKLYEIYKKYYALNEDGSYIDNTWELIKKQLQFLNIHF
jgi:hypothetical protein